MVLPPVNVAPQITLINPVASLSEDADVSSAIPVADVVVTDPDGGDNQLSLSGADAAAFSLSPDGTQLLLNAGVVLVEGDSLSVTVSVDDPSVGGTPDDSAAFTLDLTAPAAPEVPAPVSTFDLQLTPPDTLVVDGTPVVSGFFNVTSIWAFDQALNATPITPPAPIAAEIGSGLSQAIAAVPVGTRVVSVVGFFDATAPDLPAANFNLLIGSITDAADNLGFTVFLPNSTDTTAFQATDLGGTASLLDNTDLFSDTDVKPTLNLTGGDFVFDNGVDPPIFAVTSPAGDGSFTAAGFQPHGTVATPRGAQPLVVVDEGQTATNAGSFLGSTLGLTSVTASVGTAVLTGPNSFSFSLPTDDGPDDSVFVTVTGSDAAGNTVSTGFDVIVNNVAPTVSLSGPQSVDSDGTVTLNALASDPGDDTLTFAFDFDNDGAFDDAFGPSAEFDPAALGLNPGDVQAVAVQVTDSDGAVATAATTVTVVAPVVETPIDIEITPPPTLVLDGQDVTSGLFTVTTIWAFDENLNPTAVIPPAPIAAEIGSGVSAVIASVPAGTRVVSIEGFFDATDPDLPAASFNLLVGSINQSADNLGFTVFLPNDTSDTAFQITDLGVTASVLDNTDIFSDTDAKPTLSLTSGDFVFDNGQDPLIFVDLTPSGGDGSPGSANFQSHGTISTPRGAQPVVEVPEGAPAINGGVFLGSTLNLTSISATVGTATLVGPNAFTFFLPTEDGPDSQVVTVTGADDAGNTVSVSFDVIVNNVPPVVFLASPTVIAGQTVTLVPSVVDVPADTLSFSFDLDGDGVFGDAFGPTANFDPSGLGLNAGGTQAIAVQVTDDDGGVGVATATVSVIEAPGPADFGLDFSDAVLPPGVDLSILAQPLVSGQTFSVEPSLLPFFSIEADAGQQLSVVLDALPLGADAPFIFVFGPDLTSAAIAFDIDQTDIVDDPLGLLSDGPIVSDGVFIDPTQGSSLSFTSIQSGSHLILVGNLDSQGDAELLVDQGFDITATVN